MSAMAAALAGALLCIAGAAKALDRNAVAPLLRAIGVRRVAVRAARVAVPAIEVVCGAWLLSGAAARAAGVMATAVAASFVLILLLAAARGAAEPCRCFGALDRVRSHRVSLARALLLLAAATAAAVTGGATARASEWWLGVVLALTALLGFALVGELASFRAGVRRRLAAQTDMGRQMR